MRVKKILTALLLSVVLVVSTAACSTSTQTVTESSTISGTQISSNTSQTGSFDYNTVRQSPFRFLSMIWVRTIV